MFKRLVWLYDRGDYATLKNNIGQTDWEQLTDNDINKHTTSVTKMILELSKQCIPTRTVTVKPNDSAWITTQIKTTDS